jgi:hypothetical protein
LINVHAPSFGRQVRTEVLSLLKLLIKDFHSELEPISEVLVKGVAIEGEDERDPHCLGIFFECIELLFETGLVSADPDRWTRSVEELFDTLKSYFPIESTDPDDNIHENLTTLLNRCFSRFGQRSIEFLVPQLEDRDRVEAAFKALLEVSKRRPNDLLPFLIAEWTPSSPPLIGKLLQTSLVNADEEFVDSLVARIVNCKDIDLLSMCANAHTSSCISVISTLARDEANDPMLLQLLRKTEIGSDEDLNLKYAEVDTLVRRLLIKAESIAVLIPVISRLVSDIKNEETLKQVVSMLEASELETTEDVGRFYANLFLTNRSHLVNTQKVVSQLMHAGSSRSLGKIFPLISLDHLLVLSNRFDLILDAFKYSGFCEKFLAHVPDTVQLSAEVVAAIVRETRDPLIVRRFILERGVLGAMLFLEDCEDVLSSALETDEECLDLLAAMLAAGEPIGVRKTIEAIKKRLSNDRLLGILNCSTSPVVWASGVLALSPSESVIDHLTVERTDALLSQLKLEDTDFIQAIAKNLNKQSHAVIGARILACPLVDNLPESLAEGYIIESLEASDVCGCKLTIKYALVNPNWSSEFVSSLLSVLEEKLVSPTVFLRFGAVQTLAALPEMVASGKFSERQRMHVLGQLQDLINREPKRLVRKQAAIAITAWYNVSF